MEPEEISAALARLEVGQRHADEVTAELKAALALHNATLREGLDENRRLFFKELNPIKDRLAMGKGGLKAVLFGLSIFATLSTLAGWFFSNFTWKS